MQKLLYFLIICSLTLPAQEQIKIVPLDSIEFKANKIFGIDTFNTQYFSDANQSFYKRTKDTTISYANFQLGKITSANPFNPLKIILFYQDFNTVIILDNRLAEIFKIDLNTLQDYKNASYVSTAYDNSIWLFNQDTQQLELYDYKTNKTRLKTVPVQSQILDLKSDYNYCYMLTEKYLYIYGYYGNLVSKIENIGYTEMAFSKSNLLLKNKNNLFLLTKTSTKIRPIKSSNLLINQFLVTNETLYIYHNEQLIRYQLKTE